MLIYDQFGIIQNLRTCAILQTFLSRDFFVTSYSKAALDLFHAKGIYFYRNISTYPDTLHVIKARRNAPNVEL